MSSGGAGEDGDQGLETQWSDCSFAASGESLDITDQIQIPVSNGGAGEDGEQELEAQWSDCSFAASGESLDDIADQFQIPGPQMQTTAGADANAATEPLTALSVIRAGIVTITDNPTQASTSSRRSDTTNTNSKVSSISRPASDTWAERRDTPRAVSRVSRAAGVPAIGHGGTGASSGLPLAPARRLSGATRAQQSPGAERATRSQKRRAAISDLAAPPAKRPPVARLATRVQSTILWPRAVDSDTPSDKRGTAVDASRSGGLMVPDGSTSSCFRDNILECAPINSAGNVVRTHLLNREKENEVTSNEGQQFVPVFQELHYEHQREESNNVSAESQTVAEEYEVMAISPQLQQASSDTPHVMTTPGKQQTAEEQSDDSPPGGPQASEEEESISDDYEADIESDSSSSLDEDAQFTVKINKFQFMLNSIQREMEALTKPRHHKRRANNG